MTANIQYSIAFLVSLASSLSLTRFVGSHARRFGLVDPVDDRKIHTEPIPRLGGVALFCAVGLGIFALCLKSGFQTFPLGRPMFSALLGGAGMFALGLYDDLRPMRARYKLLVQVGIAAAVAVFGIRLTGVTLPFLGEFALGPWSAAIITGVWLVGVSNAFNLIDGLDGLAGGVALLALCALFIVSVLFGHIGAAITTVLLAGAIIGFLRYNFPPASIFLGDSGSLFVGFMLAGVGLVASQKTSGNVSLVIPMVTLGLPILDTALTIVRRFLRLQPIFSPDRGHIHHRLLGRGHSPRNVAFLLYIACALFSTAGAFLAYPADSVVLLVVMLSMMCLVGLALLIQRLGFIEFQELGRLARGSITPRETIGRNVRFREASTRLAELDDVRGIFEALSVVFADEQIPRAEVRLQRWFLSRRPAVVTSDGRGDDELPVWTMSHADTESEGWWEIVLPLVAADERRMGSLVIWEDGQSYAASLSHLHVISEHLRIQLQQKLQLLGWPEAEELARHAELGILPFEKAVGAENTGEFGHRALRPTGSFKDLLGPKRTK
ncbi:MAG: undecaprenyl/decaprenyl-phosphate alpha-N-acetylglucosaminyl 1-phosphate transferase [Gemmatimonadaceae bacterium]|nr:undecaprenyl/decaprenyl-phosphate alpha-N-acetylglucosaminyl 1-phosphate transferase [Gemmatimonadaceae bacterium]MBA3657005.1 undecaprenyl/decaprenyl-phosphate alpha-N-acetylglucosaminyl 1-phosphate transferase [Gemmatimonadaceae bacterium]